MSKIISFNRDKKYSILDEGSRPQFQEYTKEEIYEQVNTTSMVEFIKKLIERYQEYNTEDLSVVFLMAVSYLVDPSSYYKKENLEYLDNIVQITVFPYITKKNATNEKTSALYNEDEVDEYFENSYIVKYDKFVELLKQNNIEIPKLLSTFEGLTAKRKNPIFGFRVIAPTLEKHIKM